MAGEGLEVGTGGDYDVIIGIMLCNQDTDDNVIDLYIANSSVNYFIAKGLLHQPIW